MGKYGWNVVFIECLGGVRNWSYVRREVRMGLILVFVDEERKYFYVIGEICLFGNLFLIVLGRKN